MKFVNLLVFSFACVLAAALDSLAQTGTVNFANGAAGVDAPITHAPGQAVEGPDWRAELLYLSGTNFVPVGERIPFETNTLAGYFFGERVSVPGTQPGALTTFKIRVWNLESLAGESEAVQVRLGGDKLPPANLVGLRTLEVAPPVRLSIQKTAGTYAVSWPREYASFQLQSSRDLVSPWKPESVLKTTNAETVSVEPGPLTNRQFFRLRSF